MNQSKSVDQNTVASHSIIHFTMNIGALPYYLTLLLDIGTF